MIYSPLNYIQERSAKYERALLEKSRVIRQLESRNMNRKQRSKSMLTMTRFDFSIVVLDMQSFREALTLLQRQVEELDYLKIQHYQEIVDHEEEIWDSVQGNVCCIVSDCTTPTLSKPQVSLTVRSTMEIFEKFTSKS